MIFVRSQNKWSDLGEDPPPLPASQSLCLVEHQRSRARNGGSRPVLRQIDIDRAWQRMLERQQMCRLAMPPRSEKLKCGSPLCELGQVRLNIDDCQFGAL